LDYAPPEQRGYAYRYGQPSAKSDVFAFGMTMYRLWTGKNPHPFLERDLPDISALRDLLCDCVAEKPEERPESAQYVVSCLNTIKDTLKTEEQIKQAQKKDEFVWQQTCQTDTKSAYKAYLSGNTLKQFADEAKNQLQAIIEKEELAQRQAKELQEEIAKREAKEQAHKKSVKEAQERLAKESEQQARKNFVKKQIQERLAKESEQQARRERKQRQAEIATPQRLSALNPLDYLRLLWWVLVMPQDLNTYKNRFGDIDNEHIGKWLFSSLTWLPLLMPTLALVLELIPYRIAMTPEFYLSLILAVIVAVSIAVIVANFVASSIAMAPFSVAMVPFLVVFAITFGAAIVVAAVVVGIVQESIRTGTPSWIARFAFLLLVTAHLFLIYYCFLGGWRLFV
jgi:hypothetical protein